MRMETVFSPQDEGAVRRASHLAAKVALRIFSLTLFLLGGGSDVSLQIECGRSERNPREGY